MNTLEKVLTIGVFAVFLYFVIDAIIAMIGTQIGLDGLAPNIRYYLCALGIFDAVNIYVSFLIASWFGNKIINYLSS